ncbi:MAG: DUF6531 domain-containing protein [Candidatus Solibacter sp.]
MHAPAWTACRDCAQVGFGGPGENRFTPYEALCLGTACREPGYPRIYVNTANLTLFARVTDLAFGGPAPSLSLEHSFNMDETGSGLLGKGWSFSLGDTITTAPDGTLILRRGTGRTDRYATATGTSALFPVSGTSDTLERAPDGGYTLKSGVSTRVFNAAGELTALRTGGTLTVSLEYDGNRRLKTARYRGRSVAFTTDDAGHITSMRDDTGRTVAFAYNAEGRLAQQTNADGKTAAYEYDAQGNLTAVAWAGGKTAFHYTGDAAFASLASVTMPDSAVRLYDTPRRPSEIRSLDGNGNVTWYTSAATGLLLSVVDAAGNTVSYSYDAAGNRVRAVNAAGEAVTFSYDSKGNLTGLVDGAGNRWTATYTSAGLTRITDPNKNIWTLSYDDSGNLAGITDPRTFTTTATRDAAGQIVALADQKGNTRKYQYNSDGLVTGFTDALGNQWNYEYDGAARTLTRQDPAGATMRADYTVANRLLHVSSGDSLAVFDESGLHRDSANRLTEQLDSFGLQTSYGYDAAGQLTDITMPGGKTVSYQYDKQRRLVRVSDWQGNFAVYSYDAAGYPVSVSVSGGPVTIYQYDSGRNLKAIVSTGPDGTPVAAYRYALDSNGNRTSVSALEPNTTAATVASLEYAFDAANRPVSRSDGATYRYDARGALVAIEGAANSTFAYDPFGRLQARTGDATSSSAYDSLGLRNGRNDRRLVYDLSGEQPRVIMEVNGDNTPVAWYIHGLGLLWKVAADGTGYFYHFDGDGNTVALSTPAKGVVNTYRYDTRGNLLAASEGVDNPFRARGESGWLDDGAGLLFTGSRYVLPELRLSLNGIIDLAAPLPELQPQLSGLGACFLEGVATCQALSGRRAR